MNKTDNFMIRVSPKLKKLVNKAAEDQGMASSELIRELLLTVFIEGNEKLLVNKYLLDKAARIAEESKQLIKDKKHSANLAELYNQFSKIRIDILNLLAGGKGNKALNKYSEVFRLFGEIEEQLRL